MKSIAPPCWGESSYAGDTRAKGLKIKCGRSHFKGALGVDFKVVTSAGDLPDDGV